MFSETKIPRPLKEEYNNLFYKFNKITFLIDFLFNNK